MGHVGHVSVPVNMFREVKSGSAKLYGYLAGQAQPGDNRVSVSMWQISTEAKMGNTAIANAIADLRATGWVAVVPPEDIRDPQQYVLHGLRNPCETAAA